MGVRRRIAIIGTLAIVLAAAGMGNSPAYRRVASSVQSFQRNLGELKKAESMSAIERIVFSLVLAGAKAPSATTTIGRS